MSEESNIAVRPSGELSHPYRTSVARLIKDTRKSIATFGHAVRSIDLVLELLELIDRGALVDLERADLISMLGDMRAIRSRMWLIARRTENAYAVVKWIGPANVLALAAALWKHDPSATISIGTLMLTILAFSVVGRAGANADEATRLLDEAMGRFSAELELRNKKVLE